MASSAQINLEDLMMVWLDDEPTSYSCWENQVRSIVNYVKVFNNLHDLKQYIRKDGKYELICLIVCNQLAEEILKNKFLLDQIQSTYLFGIEEQKTNHKIHGFFASMDTLLARLAEDVTAYYNWKNPLAKAFSPRILFDDNGCFSSALRRVSTCSVGAMLYLQRQLSEANEHSAAFLWWTYLIQGFIELPINPESKHKFLNNCRQQYDGNKYELDKVADFEATYSSDKAIYWFTRDSFLYRILNKSLRTENLEYIFKLRFFIVDLHQQLCKLCSTQNIGPLTVYRGQTFSRQEFNSISFGNLISMNSFLSTSTDPEVALMYTESNPGITGKTQDLSFFKSDNDHESVFLEIEVNNTITTKRKPFANISEYSCMQHEKEVLFSIGSLFRVISVDQLFGGKHHVKLELVGEDDQIVKRILKRYEGIIENFKSPLTLATIGKLLPLMDSGVKKGDYYRLLREELSINHSRIQNIEKSSMAYVTIIGSDLIKYLQERTVEIDQKAFHYAIQKIDNWSIHRLIGYIKKKRFEPTTYFVFVIDMKILRDRISPRALREIFNIWKVFKKAYSQSKLYIATLPLLRACETESSLTHLQHNIQEYNKKLCEFNPDDIIKIEHDDYLADYDDDGNIYLIQSGIDVLNKSIDDYLSKSMQQRI